MPLSEASLTIPLDSLVALPPGAAYTRKDGQANLTVTYERKGSQPGKLNVKASCDSLMLVCEEYLEIISSLRNTIRQMESQAEVVEKPPVNYWEYIIYFLAGLVTGAVLTVITLTIKRK